LINSNSNVSTDALIEELWGQAVPRSAAGTLQTYIYQLRKILRSVGGGSNSADLLTNPGGYQLRLSDQQLDAFEFESLARQGRTALMKGDTELASSLLHHALHLWRGRTLAGVKCGARLNAHIVGLEEDRLSVLEQRIEADMQLGRHRDLVGELKSMVTTHPLHEWLYARLIIALHLSGRRGEALRVYQTIRRGLQEELGLDPGPELQQIHRAVLIGSASGYFRRLTSVGTE
jgi:DNA-binding SARP family transcriptional activator